MILTPLGLVPVSLEDLNPFAHLDAPTWVLRHQPEHDWIRRELTRLGLHSQAFATVDVNGDGMKQRLAFALETLGLSHEVHQPISADQREQARASLRHEQGVDKQCVMLNLDRTSAEQVMKGASFVVNREGRMKNINDADGAHLFSPRCVMEDFRWRQRAPMPCWRYALNRCPPRSPEPSGGVTAPRYLPSWLLTRTLNPSSARDATCSMASSKHAIHGWRRERRASSPTKRGAS